MKIGVSTSCLYPQYTEDALRFLCQNGVKNIEIFFNTDCEIADGFIYDLQKIKEQYGVNIVAVHSFACAYETTLLFSEYERRFYDGIKLYNKMFAAAKELGAGVLSIHGSKHLNVDPQFYCDRFKTLSDEAAGFGVTLCQENVRAFASQDCDFIKDMCEYLGDSAAFTLDIKQCLRSGVSVFDMAKSMGEHIKHVHISDSTLNCDCLLPTAGGFDFAGFFTLLKSFGYDKNCIIEVYKNAYENQKQIIDCYNKMLKMV